MVNTSLGLERPRWQRYTVAVAVSSAAIVARFTLDRLWGTDVKPFLILFPAVTFVAWFGGFRAGLLAIALCSVAAVSLPGGIRSTVDVVGIAMFVLGTIFIAALARSVQRARVSAHREQALGAAALARAEAQESRAEQLQRAREELLAIVAHDLRNPIHTIGMNVSAMKRDAGAGDTVRKRIDAIERSLAHMNHLIRDLLDAAQIENGALVVTMMPHAAEGIVGDAVALLAGAADSKGIRIDNEAGVMPTLQCDPERLVQVIGNLLANAVKFTPTGGTIRVRTVVEEQCVRFEIADSGPGIPAEDISRVFDRHWKARSAGSGLGLYIARGVVQAHGGRIWIHSEPGRGTSVFFRIPRASDEVGASNEDSRSFARITLGKKSGG